MGDCVEGALYAPPRNTMMLLNRNHIKKNLTLKGNSINYFPCKVGKSVDRDQLGAQSQN